MKLYELAYACRLYREVAQFDLAYCEMRKALGQNPDLASQAQLDGLMQFLNDWLCRIPEKYFPCLKERLRQWALLWIPQLPNAATEIRSLNDADRAQIADSYGELLKLGAGLHFQDTAAAKTLHALRPHSLPMWDAKIKDWFSTSAPSRRTAGQTYSDFLRHVAQQISGLEADVARLGHSLGEVSQLVQRSGASLVKLADEYYWITITYGHTVPTRDELEQWLRWLEEPKLKAHAL